MKIIEHTFADPHTIVKVEEDVIFKFGGTKLKVNPVVVRLVGVGVSTRNISDGDAINYNLGFKYAFARAKKNLRQQIKALSSANIVISDTTVAAEMARIQKAVKKNTQTTGAKVTTGRFFHHLLEDLRDGTDCKRGYTCHK